MSDATDFIRRAPLGQQIGFLLGAIAIVGIAVFAYFLASEVEFEPLFSDLNQEDAARLVEELTDKKVPFSVSDDGKTIMMDKTSVAQTRLELAGSGLGIHGGQGFELFDNVEQGMTEFAQQINYQRALQGEISRTIVGLNEVQYARVHLVLPEKALFQKDQTESKAAITLIQKPDMSLSASQIQGVQDLVAAAVEGLERSNVTILNERGVVLSQSGDEALTNIASRLGQKQEVEFYLSRKAEKLMTQMFGVGNAVVNVDVLLNYDEIQVTREVYNSSDSDKNTGVLVKSKTQRSYTSAPKANGGSATQKPYSETTDTEYKVGKSIEQVVESSGSIERMTISVMLPENTDAETVTALKQLVATAVGMQAERGDLIEIYALPAHFTSQPIDAEVDRQLDAQSVSRQTSPVVSMATNRYLDLASRPGVVLGLCAILMISIIGIVAILLKNQAPADETGLSAEQKEILLADVKRWLSNDSVTATAGTNGEK